MVDELLGIGGHARLGLHTGDLHLQFGSGVIRIDTLECVVEACEDDLTGSICPCVNGHLRLIGCAGNDIIRIGVIAGIIWVGQKLLCLTPSDLVAGQLLGGQVAVLLADTAGNHGNGDVGFFGQLEIIGQHILQSRFVVQLAAMANL